MPTGERFDCPAETPVLNAAHAADILIPYSCRGGRCGSCRCRLLEGEVGYRGDLPEALDAADKARGFTLLCCAFARSDLVIELAPVGIDDDESHASA